MRGVHPRERENAELRGAIKVALAMLQIGHHDLARTALLAVMVEEVEAS